MSILVNCDSPRYFTCVFFDNLVFPQCGTSNYTAVGCEYFLLRCCSLRISFIMSNCISTASVWQFSYFFHIEVFTVQTVSPTNQHPYPSPTHTHTPTPPPPSPPSASSPVHLTEALFDSQAPTNARQRPIVLQLPGSEGRRLLGGGGSFRVVRWKGFRDTFRGNTRSAAGTMHRFID